MLSNQLIPGPEFNKTIKEMACPYEEWRLQSDRTMDERIKHIRFQKATAFPESWTRVSTLRGDYPVRANWDKDSATLTIVSGADQIRCNENMSCMFSGLAALESIDASALYTGDADHALYTFFGNLSLHDLDLSSWDTRNLTSATSMLEFCPSLERVDVSGWDTGKLERASYFVSGCTSLREIDLSSWSERAAKSARGAVRGTASEMGENQGLVGTKFIMPRHKDFVDRMVERAVDRVAEFVR